VQAIREILPIHNHTVTISLPIEFGSSEVEVIVLPHSKERKKRSLEQISVWDDEAISDIENALGKLTLEDVKNFATISGVRGLFPSLSDEFIVDTKPQAKPSLSSQNRASFTG